MKNTSVLFKSITVLFLLALLPGCSSTLGGMLKQNPTSASQNNCSNCPPCQGTSNGDVTVKGLDSMSWGDRLKLNGLNLAFDSMGLGWKATIDDTGAFKAAGPFQSLPIEILFNAGSGQMFGFKGLRLADIDIPLSKEGVMPALNDNIMRLLQKKGVSEQTANTLSTGLQPILSAIQKVF